MSNKQKVEIVHGEYKGIVGTLVGVLWAANVALVETCEGKEITVKLNDVKSI